MKKMKVLWIIERIDGTKIRIVTQENTKPIPGDGHIVEGIPVAIVSTVTTPNLGELDKFDIAVEAKEQKI